MIALLLAIISLVLFIPIMLEFVRTGLVPRLPTLVVSGFVMLAAIYCFFSGLVLHNLNHKNRQDFEFHLHQASNTKKQLMCENQERDNA